MDKMLIGQMVQDYSMLHEKLRPDMNYDIIERPLFIGGRAAFFYCVNGFVSDENIQKIVQFFLGVKGSEMPKEAEAFAESYAAYGDVVLKQDISSLITAVLSGLGILVVDGYDSGLVFDIRNYPGRRRAAGEGQGSARSTRRILRERRYEYRIDPPPHPGSETSHRDVPGGRYFPYRCCCCLYGRHRS